VLADAPLQRAEQPQRFAQRAALLVGVLVLAHALERALPVGQLGVELRGGRFSIETCPAHMLGVQLCARRTPYAVRLTGRPA
jgi:hypothetical protein